MNRFLPVMTGMLLLCATPSSYALDEVIDPAAIAQLKNQITKMQEQIDQLNQMRNKLQEQLDAIGAVGQIVVPMVNMAQMASNASRNAACLLPDLESLMPGVEFDNLNFGSICQAGSAYRKSLWMLPEDVEEMVWDKQQEVRKAVERLRENVAVDAASKGMGSADIAITEADRLNSAATELENAANSARNENERQAVIAQGTVLQARAQVQQAQMMAQLLKIQSTWFTLTALPAESALANDDGKAEGVRNDGPLNSDDHPWRQACHPTGQPPWHQQRQLPASASRGHRYIAQ